MFRFIIFCVVSCFLINVINSQKYSTKYDGINIDAILGNQRVLNAYVKCLLDEGRCTEEGSELRRTIPDALQTNCMSCSPGQQHTAMRVVSYLTANRPDAWKRLTAKYDPQGYYARKFRQQG